MPHSLAGASGLSGGLAKQPCLESGHITAPAGLLTQRSPPARKGHFIHSSFSLLLPFALRKDKHKTAEPDYTCKAVAGGGGGQLSSDRPVKNSLFQFSEGFENKQGVPRKECSKLPRTESDHWIVSPSTV